MVSSMVCPGVTIGDRCIIGAGSVVVKDIPSDSMAVGNPAKVIKSLKELRDTKVSQTPLSERRSISSLCYSIVLITISFTIFAQHLT